MEGYGEHLYGIDKDDIMQHRDNASATKIIGKHGNIKENHTFLLSLDGTATKRSIT